MGRGHFGHRLAFAPDGKLYISNGEREKFDPAQDMSATLGKIVRLNDDGSVPTDNPFAKSGGAAAQIWSLGHRNILGLAFDGRGQLWVAEMGPKGGDEFNRIERGSNYGYPIVSNGSHYDGRDIPDHPTRPEFNAPEINWNALSPAGLMIYSGRLFPQWRGNAFVGGAFREDFGPGPDQRHDRARSRALGHGGPHSRGGAGPGRSHLRAGGPARGRRRTAAAADAARLSSNSLNVSRCRPHTPFALSLSKGCPSLSAEGKAGLRQAQPERRRDKPSFVNVARAGEPCLDLIDLSGWRFRSVHQALFTRRPSAAPKRFIQIFL